MKNKSIIMTLFSICLLTSFYSTNSMFSGLTNYFKKQYRLWDCKDNFEYIEKCLTVGDTKAVESFVDEAFSNGLNPLTIACIKGDTKMVKMLLINIIL